MLGRTENCENAQIVLAIAPNGRIIRAVDRPLPRLGDQGLETQMQKFTLTNDFHNTEATIRPVAITSGRFAGLHMVSRATLLRVKRKLCGMTGCCCGGQFGERGGAYLRVVNEDGDRNLIIDIGGSHAYE